MKKIVPCILSVLLLFCSCGDKSKTNGNSWRFISSYDLYESSKKGTFVITTLERLDFLDFTTMQESPVCDKPDCQHSNSSTCQAFNKDNHPFIYKDKIYFFKITDRYKVKDDDSDNERYTMDTQLWQCGVNGSDEKKLAEFKGLICENYNKCILVGDKLYMTPVTTSFDKDNNELEPSTKLISYDLANNKTEDMGELVKGYNSGATQEGLWDNKIILYISKCKENLPYMERVEKYAKENNVSKDEAMNKINEQEYFDRSMMEYDLNSNSVNDCDLPQPLGISEKYYFYNDGNDLMYMTQDGKKNKIKDITNTNGMKLYDNYAVITKDGGNMYLFNYDTQEVKKIKTKSGQVISGIFGDEIILKDLNDIGNPSYLKESISEMEM